MWDEASAYGDVVYEYNNSGAAVANYVLAGTQLISQTRGTTTKYFLQDGQGSTRGLLSNVANPTISDVTDTYSYTAFGEIYAPGTSGTTTNPYRYTGQQLDTATGLYSLRARYYNPALGRFLSGDTYPINVGNPVELNRYVYTANRPINLSDPTGKNAILEYGALLATIGGGAASISAIACGHNPYQAFFLGAAFGLVFAGGFAGLAYLSPNLAIAVGVGIAGGQAAYSTYDFLANNTTWCGATNAALSLLFFGLALHGGANYLAEKYLGGLSDIGYLGELNNPNGTGHNGYYTGEYTPIEPSISGTGPTVDQLIDMGKAFNLSRMIFNSVAQARNAVREAGFILDTKNTKYLGKGGIEYAQEVYKSFTKVAEFRLKVPDLGYPENQGAMPGSMTLRITIKVFPNELNFFNDVIVQPGANPQSNYGYTDPFGQRWINIMNGHYAPNSEAHTIINP